MTHEPQASKVHSSNVTVIPSSKHEIILKGCTPTPLANYLKALGVLRLLSTKYPDIRGHWRNDYFVLRAPNLEQQNVITFFLEKYSPTPIMAPWNGGSGFYDKDNKEAINSIQKSTDERFSIYRKCLNVAEDVLGDRSTAPKDAEKVALLTSIRALLPEEVLAWFDASVSLSDGSLHFPPLLGTGGNDGRLDFTNNFMQRLTDVLDLEQGGATKLSRQWLGMSLFADVTSGLVKKAIGQFSPGQAGGYNAGTGFDADALINPWDFVLMIEGALLFATTVVRRLGGIGGNLASLPFTVIPRATEGVFVPADETPAKTKRQVAEMWLPLWNQPAEYRELEVVFREGRITLHGRSVSNGHDCIRALNSLGASRGISGFQRYAFLKRNGDSFFAVHSGRFSVRASHYSGLIDELDRENFLSKLQTFVRKRKKTESGEWEASTKLRMLGRKLGSLMSRVLCKDDRRALLQLLENLGELQQVITYSKRAAKKDSAINKLPPVPRLSEQWVTMADDKSIAYRIAKSLAGLRGEKDNPLPLSAQLLPVWRRQPGQWVSSLPSDKRDDFRVYTGLKASLPETLYALLERRLWLADKLEMKDKPLNSSAGVTLDDIAFFLCDKSMDERIAKLLPGLCLCKIPEDEEKKAGESTLPAAFGLMKLALTPDSIFRSLGMMAEKDHMPVPAGMVAQLRAGNQSDRAVKTARRRLQASGLEPLVSIPRLEGIEPLRAVAALLIPLRFGATGKLNRKLLHKTSEKEEKTA